MSVRTAGTTPIGSDFAAPRASELRAAPASPPWELPGRLTEYVQTGAQALALVERALSARGVRTLLVPAHLCDTMIRPFADRGWALVPVPVDAGVRIDLDALRDAADAAGPGAALLAAEYFGRVPGSAAREAREALAARGVAVVEDETHRVLAPGGAPADYAIGSLRKLLPLADGAYVRHGGPPLATGLAPTAAAALRWSAMDAARADRAPGSRERVRSRFVRANAELAAARSPAAASERTLELLPLLDYDALAARRRRNAASLASALAPLGVPVITPPDDTAVPSHLVVELPGAPGVQRRLARRGVFCPVHWARSEILPPGLPWNDRLLSLPVDHRYDDAHMHRIADALAEELRA